MVGRLETMLSGERGCTIPTAIDCGYPRAVRAPQEPKQGERGGGIKLRVKRSQQRL